MWPRSPWCTPAPAGSGRQAFQFARSGRNRQIGACVTRLQLQRRSGDPARGGPAAGRRRDARLARLRPVRDGDEPSRQGLHLDRRGGRGRSAEAARDPRRLPGALPAGRGVAAVRDDPDEPAARQGRRRLRAHRRVGEEGDQGRPGLRPRSTSPRAPRTARFTYVPDPADLAARATTRRTCTTPPTRPSAASSSASCPTPATCRWSATCRPTSCPGRSTCPGSA